MVFWFARLSTQTSTLETGLQANITMHKKRPETVVINVHEDTSVVKASAGGRGGTIPVY